MNELGSEIERLAQADPEALRYHLREGHLVQWLNSSNEKELAGQLRGVENAEEAREKVKRYLEMSLLDQSSASHQGRGVMYY